MTKKLRFTRTASVTTTGWITIDADTDEEAIEQAYTGDWDRYLELSHEYDDEEWEFEKDES